MKSVCATSGFVAVLSIERVIPHPPLRQTFSNFSQPFHELRDITGSLCCVFVVPNRSAMYTFLLVVALCLVQLFSVASEGISHSSHLMLAAAEKGETKTVIDYITATGVPMNVKNNYGVSAILFAANNGHLDLLKALVEVGANIEDRSNNWKTPLNWAATWGHFPCVKYLVSVGANISSYDAKGVTPLMAATQKGDIEIVQYLLDQGANPVVKNVFNGTALSIARIQNNTQLISLLEPYYPEEEETSPYVIAFHMLKAELIKLSEVVVQESSRIWKDVLAYYAVAQQEVLRRWEQYQQQQQQAAASAHGSVSESSGCSSGECAGGRSSSKHERETDEF